MVIPDLLVGCVLIIDSLFSLGFLSFFFASSAGLSSPVLFFLLSVFYWAFQLLFLVSLLGCAYCDPASSLFLKFPLRFILISRQISPSLSFISDTVRLSPFVSTLCLLALRIPRSLGFLEFLEFLEFLAFRQYLSFSTFYLFV